MKYPTLVLLGPHTTCNYRCVFCENPHMEHKINSLDKFLTPDIQKLIENAVTVDISGYGEIISNPDFKKIVDLLGTYNRQFSMSTNGALLTKDIIDFLADSSLSLLNVSLNSLDPETYAYLSGGVGQLDKVFQFRSEKEKKAFLQTMVNNFISLAKSDGHVDAH